MDARASSKKKKSEAARRKDLILDLLEREGFGWWHWNVEDGTVDWSPEVYKLFGAPRFDNRIETFQKLIHPDDLEQAMKRLSTAMKASGRVAGCFRVLGEDGQTRYVYHSGQLLLDRQGKLSAIVGFFRSGRDDERGDASFEATIQALKPPSTETKLIALSNKLNAAAHSRDPMDRERAEIGYLEFILTRLEDASGARTMARRLFNRFGSFPKIIAAKPEDLVKVEGCGPEHAALFDLVRSATQCLLQPRDMPISFDNPRNLILYFRALQTYTEKEQFRVAFFNRAKHLIHDEMLSEGTIDFTPVFIRDIIKRALDLNSHSIVLVHNHPSGDPTPSLADIETTRKIAKAASAVGLQVRDHIILGSYGEVSFREKGLLN